MIYALHVVCGNAGVGKTTYGAELAQKLGGALLDIDTVSERLVRVGLVGHGLDPDDRDSPRYKQLFREPIHETLWALAESNLRSIPCVVVAPFTQERRQSSFPESIRNRTSAPLTIHFLWCEEAERRRRISLRQNPRDAAKLSNWDSYSRSGLDPGRPPFEHLFVDTTARAATPLATARKLT